MFWLIESLGFTRNRSPRGKQTGSLTLSSRAKSDVAEGSRFVIILLCFFLFSFAAAVHAQATPSPANAEDSSQKRPFRSITPELGVPIPGLELGAAKQEEGSVTVPFLAQYIAGSYRYAIAIALVAAMIMVVYGGFRYLLGSAFSDVQRGKEIIRDAIGGLIILLGGYLILRTINPETTILQSLTLRSVEMEQVEFAQMNTRTDTAEGEGQEALSEASRDCPVANLPVGCTPSTSGNILHGPQTCQDLPMSRDPRRSALLERIPSILRATDPGQRVAEAANMAANCGMHNGSCGETARTIIRRIAGLQERTIFHSQELVRLGISSVCAAKCAATPTPGCSTNTAEGVARVRATASARQDSVANMLQIGDWFQIFNGNASCGGGHSMIFMGWEGSGPYARVVQGRWGFNASRGRTCLKTNCAGGRFAPIYRIIRGS